MEPILLPIVASQNGKNFRATTVSWTYYAFKYGSVYEVLYAYLTHRNT